MVFRSVAFKQLVSTQSYSRLLVSAHPEINLEIATAAEFPVADLEGDCHLVVLVEGFVEAFALVSLHLDVVGRCGGDKAARCSEHGEGGKQHGGWTLCAAVL